MSELDQEIQKRVLPHRRSKQKLLESKILFDIDDSEDEIGESSKKPRKAPKNSNDVVIKTKKYSNKTIVKTDTESEYGDTSADDDYEDPSPTRKVKKTIKSKGHRNKNKTIVKMESDSDDDYEDDGPSSLSRKKKNINVSSVNQYKCSKCSNTYATRGFLSLHMKTHGEDRIACDLCPSTFANARNLKEHLVFMHTEDGKILYKKKLAKKKEYSKNRHRPYLEFRSVYSEVDSKFARNKKKPPKTLPTIPCLKCGLFFDDQESLDAHTESHDYDDDASLETEAVVTEIKRFLCSVTGCTAKFSTEIEWKMHVKSHRPNKVGCPTCGNKYKNLTTMRSHMRRIHDEEGRKIAKRHRKTYRERLKARKLNNLKSSIDRPKKSSSSRNPSDSGYWDQIDQKLAPAKFEKIKVEPSDDSSSEDETDHHVNDNDLKVETLDTDDEDDEEEKE